MSNGSAGIEARSIKLYALCVMRYALRFTLYALRVTLYALRFTRYTLGKEQTDIKLFFFKIIFDHFIKSVFPI